MRITVSIWNTDSMHIGMTVKERGESAGSTEKTLLDLDRVEKKSGLDALNATLKAHVL